MRNHIILVAAVMLASCGGPADNAHHASEQTVVNRQTASVLDVPQVPPVLFGKRPPNTPITEANMPYFDVVTYCELKTAKQEKLARGPLYEACAEDQVHYRSIIGETIDARKFQDADIIRCAKATRTAYQGEWYCLNGQEF